MDHSTETVHARRRRIRRLLYQCKSGDPPLHVRVSDGAGGSPAVLLALHRRLGARWDLYVDCAAMWRQKHADAFATVFKVTRDGTEKWLRAQMLDNPDRILFMIEADKEQPIGHLGLVVEDFEGNWAEVDNVIRGEEAGARGVMTHSLRTLCGWAFDVLRLSALRLRVFADNDRAIRLYERCGFRETERIPVARVESEGVTRWLPASGDQQSERCFSLMALENAPARHPPHQGW